MKYRFIVFLIFVIFLSLYTVKGTHSLDSDFGWHIRMGQIILHHGIPKTDPFSYTMPSYPFVDHEWLTNTLIAMLYPLIGISGLAIIFSAIAVISIYLQIPRKLFGWSSLLIILIAGALFPTFGVRTQVISWILFSLIVFIVRKQQKSFLYRFLPIPLLLIWANLHGAFPIGLIFLALYFITHWIKNKRIYFGEIAIFLATFSVTLINPYGYRLWWEVWMQVSDSRLHFSIVEWWPSLFFINISLWMYVVVSIMLAFRYRNKFNIFYKTIYIFFLLAGISSYRHMPLWIIVSLYPTSLSFNYFYEEISNFTFGSERVKVFYKVLIALALLSLFWPVGWYLVSLHEIQENSHYPSKAVTFLKKNLPKGQIFTVYEWGGYLDWKLPEKRVFIDGRMPSFRRNEHIKNESDYAFLEYRKALDGDKKKFITVMKKYNVELVLMPKPKYSKDTLDFFIEKFIKISKNTKKKENKFADFTVMYQDTNAIIYKIK